jgi:hypothetical protein
MATNMPKPKSTKKPNVKVLPKKKSGSIGKLTNMSTKPKPKPGLTFAIPGGMQINSNDLGKKKPSPKPSTIKKNQQKIKDTLNSGTGAMNSQQYDAYLKKVLAEMNKKK